MMQARFMVIDLHAGIDLSVNRKMNIDHAEFYSSLFIVQWQTKLSTNHMSTVKLDVTGKSSRLFTLKIKMYIRGPERI